MCDVCTRAKKSGLKEGMKLIADAVRLCKGGDRACLDMTLGELLTEGGPRSEDIFDRGLRKSLKHRP